MDWHVLGDADVLYGCGSTYSRTAWARRARGPFVVHTHRTGGKGRKSKEGPSCYQVAS